MATLTVYPAVGRTEYAEDGVTVIPVPGAVVTISDYYRDLLRSGRLLTYNPLETADDPVDLAPPEASGAVVNVRDYGAVGDDATNDRDAIYSALLAAESTGRPLYLPKGTYLIGPTASAPYPNLRITSIGLRIIGDGPRVSVLKLSATWTNVSNPDVPAIFSIIHPDVLSGAHASSESGYTLSDISFEGLGFTGLGLSDTVTVKAITSKGSQDITVARCRFYDFGGEMVWPGGSGPTSENKRWNITGNVFEQSVRAQRPGSSLQLNVDDSTVSGNRFIKCTYAIGVTGNNNTITGNTLVDSWGNAIGVGETAPTEVGQRNTITGNTIYQENASDHGPIGINLDVADGCVVSSNTIKVRNVVATGAHTTRAIRTDADGLGNSIDGNAIELDMAGLAAAMEGIRAELESGTASLTISNNKIRYKNEATSVPRTGIGAFTIGDGAIMRVTISANTIDGMSITNTGGEGNAVQADEYGGSAARMYCTAIGNTSTGGRQLYRSLATGITRNYTSHDNVAIFTSTTAAVVVE